LASPSSSASGSAVLILLKRLTQKDKIDEHQKWDANKHQGYNQGSNHVSLLDLTQTM